MKSRTKTIAVLFSDIVKSAEITEDHLVDILGSFQMERIADARHYQSHVYSKSWGDGLYVCMEDASELCDYALRLKDSHRSTNWIKLGFKRDVQVRIGLHLTRAQVVQDSSEVVDVRGSGISAAARVEPIVEPNMIYSTEQMQSILSTDPHTKAMLKSVGVKELAKGFGKKQLFEVIWEYEANQSGSDINSQEIFSFPKVLTEKDIDDLISSAYDETLKHIRKQLEALTNSDKRITSTLKEITSESMWCKIYLDGSVKAECSIWINRDHMSHSIHYSNSITTTGGSWNDSISVDLQGDQVRFKPMSLSNFGSDTEVDIRTPTDVGEYFLNRLTNQLNRGF